MGRDGGVALAAGLGGEIGGCGGCWDGERGGGDGCALGFGNGCGAQDGGWCRVCGGDRIWEGGVWVLCCC